MLTGVLLGVLVMAAPADPKPFLHPLFADHMVLQRDRPVPVWGWTKPGAAVTVALLGRTATGRSAPDGRWEVMIGPFPAGGPHTMTVGGPQRVVVADLLVGDVWVCSGQSNMEMGIGQCLSATTEIAAAAFPGIRLLSVPKRIEFSPVTVPEVRWEPCTPATIATGGWGGFSAAGYFFGRMLHRELGVPVGLIHTSWGGTPGEAWVSRGSLAALPDFVAPLADLDRDIATWTKGLPAFEAALSAWWKTADPGSATTPGWEAPGLDEAAWKPMALPARWEDAGLPGYDGFTWFRRTLTIPATWTGRPLTLHLGKIDDRDATFVNGTKVGGLENWEALRTYTVPESTVTSPRLVIAVRVLDTGGAGGLYGPDEEMWIAPADAPADRIRLAGTWQFRTGGDLKGTPMPQRMDRNPNRVTVLSNGMIEPIVPFGIRGAIWYQGESNVGRAGQYARLLPALIGDWRARFRSGEFPFLIVQLANFLEPPKEPAEDPWAELREAQAKTAATVPGAGLAVAIDIGDAKDIHPRNKQEVGRRLALAALAGTYGRPVEGSGPVYRSMTVAGRSVRIAFDHAKGLKATDGGRSVGGFAVAGPDGKFVWADAKLDGASVVVSSPKVSRPVAVRYAWAANPACNLVNGAGLPAVPFRTDTPTR